MSLYLHMHLYLHLHLCLYLYPPTATLRLLPRHPEALPQSSPQLLHLPCCSVNSGTTSLLRVALSFPRQLKSILNTQPQQLTEPSRPLRPRPRTRAMAFSTPIPLRRLLLLLLLLLVRRLIPLLLLMLSKLRVHQSSARSNTKIALLG